RRWMERRGITHQELELAVSNLATVAKLRERLVGNRVEEYFETHAADFDTAYVARFALSEILAATTLADQIRSGDADFFNAAQHAFKQSGQATGDLFAAVRRRDAAEEIRDSMFRSSHACVLG